MTITSPRFAGCKALILLTMLAGSVASPAVTVVQPGNTFTIDQGVEFTITNDGGVAFLFSWTDGGIPHAASNPILLLDRGQTFTFVRATPGHPLTLTDDTLPVTESGGAYERATTDVLTLLGAIVPISDPSLSGSNPTDTTTAALVLDTTALSPGQEFYYTSAVLAETKMTGAITIVPEPSSGLLTVVGLLVLGRRRRH